MRARGSVAVTAGAGTGKTHMLTERYLHHLTEDRLRPLQIVAGTFTEAAAAELRGRVRERLRSVPELVHLAAELEAAQIGTLHSLAGRICREHPDAAGVPWDFAVQDELQQRLWLDRHFRAALALLPQGVGRAVPFVTLSNTLRALLADPYTAEQALAADTSEWPRLIRQEQERAYSRIAAGEPWRRALATLDEHQGPANDKLELQRRAALTAVAAFERGKFTTEACAALDGLSKRAGSAKVWGEAVDAVKEACATLRDSYRSVKYAFELSLSTADDSLSRALPSLREAYAFMEEQLAQVKRSERLLDFNDLELHALKALEREEVRDFYHRRWRAFLVDEFQDTNPVQAELLSRLMGSAARPGARLTVVGDEKQSIYGFRRADLTVFRAVREAIHDEGGEIVELSTSFRTHQGLVGPLNEVVAPALAELHQPLNGARGEAPGEAPFLSVQLVVGGADLKQFRQRAEAHHVGELIDEYLRNGTPVHDKATGTLRPARPGDIAILARSWDTLGPYGDELAARGIPTIHAGGGNLLEQREAKDALSLLRFLAEPNDDLSLAALLRSPFFAVDDPGLLELAHAAGRRNSSWWEALSARAMVEGPGSLENAAAVLSILRRQRFEDTPSRLLTLADELTGYAAVIANLPGGQRRLADWRGMNDFVAQLERGFEDTFAVVRELRLLSAVKDAKVPRPAMEARDAISLMSVHNAKGLEWPIVIIPDITGRSSGGVGATLFDAQAGVAFKVRDANGEEAEPALYTILKERRKQYESDEELRVLYVALTRARDRVVLSGSSESSGRLRFLEAGLEAAGIAARHLPFDPLTAVPKTPLADPPEAYAQRLLGGTGPGLTELPVTSLSTYLVCPKRFHFEQVLRHPGIGEGMAEDAAGVPTDATHAPSSDSEGDDDAVTPAAQLGSGVAARVGVLTHLALERDITDLSELERFDSTLDRSSIQLALQFARTFRESPAFTAVREQITERELQVSLDTAVCGGRIVLHGIADAVGAKFVLDFKTGARREEDAHLLQVAVYAQALGRQHAYIAYLREGELVDFSPADLTAGRENVEQVLRGIEAGEFTATPSLNKCAACAYEPICEASALRSRAPLAGA